MRSPSSSSCLRNISSQQARTRPWHRRTKQPRPQAKLAPAPSLLSLVAIARGLAGPEDQLTRQEIDRWVAKFEAANE